MKRLRMIGAAFSALALVVSAVLFWFEKSLLDVLFGIFFLLLMVFFLNWSEESTGG